MFRKKLINDVNNIITELRKFKLVRDESGLSQKETGRNTLELSFSSKTSENNVLYDNNLSTNEILTHLLKHNQYLVLLYDKSIIQAEFIIKDNSIIKERLVFIKKHNKVWSKEEIQDADNYDIDWFEEQDGIPIFIRVDYDPLEHIEGEHPSCHMTLSNCETCRIPMKGPLSFSEFINFVLIHFYNVHLKNIVSVSNENALTDIEKKMIHLNW